MANRNVFKILSSFGPGGCIATFTEKICHNLFYDAYEQGDPQEAPSQEFQQKAKEQRQAYVDELFEKRGGFERHMNSLSETTQKAAYEELCQIIFKHKQLIARSEMSRLARERLFFSTNSIQYKRLVEASRRVDGDTTDNLIKMALHIVKAANTKILQDEYSIISGTKLEGDLEGANIETRVPLARANELLVEWKKVLFDYEREGNNIDALFQSGAGASEGLINNASSAELETLKDKLFIATGEDQLDTWEAFNHYNLDTKLTDHDRQAFQ